MKLHIKNHDYWHKGAAYGQDETLHYIQDSQELKVKAHDIIFKLIKNSIDGSKFKYRDVYHSKFNLLFFCGKIIPVIELWVDSKYIYVYSVDDFKKLTDEQLKPIFRFHREYNRDEFTKSVKEFFTDFNELSMPDELFLEVGSPIFLWKDICDINKYYNDEIELQKDPVLKNMGFQKVMTPDVCFQEISTYYSNVFINYPKPTVQISDKSKINKHGFDKFSFRKDKQIK